MTCIMPGCTKSALVGSNYCALHEPIAGASVASGTRPQPAPRVNGLVMIALIVAALVLGTCSFWQEAPLSGSYTADRYDFPHVHIWLAMLGAIACVVALVYLLIFRWGRKR